MLCFAIATWSFASKSAPTADLLEVADTSNLVSRMDDCGGFTLRTHEDNVDKVRRSWHRLHLFEVVDWHGGCLVGSSVCFLPLAGMMVC
jgi:hypothetical protein